MPVGRGGGVKRVEVKGLSLFFPPLHSNAFNPTTPTHGHFSVSCVFKVRLQYKKKVRMKT